MNLPVIEGLIRRRILVNFRVDPEVIRPQVPQAFQIEIVHGFAMAGLCLIRLEGIRPRHLPGIAGLESENVAYRVAGQWERDGQRRHGVYIPRRDTSSTLQQRLGGRIFPGEYHHSVFDVRDEGSTLAITCRSDDGGGDVRLLAREASGFPADSVLGSLEEASAFFERGAVGYSATKKSKQLDGVLLSTTEWSVSPLEVELVESAFFDDPRRFPRGSVALDNALIMRNVRHEWRSLRAIRAA
jgi:hypothetical protein